MICLETRRLEPDRFTEEILEAGIGAYRYASSVFPICGRPIEKVVNTSDVGKAPLHMPELVGTVANCKVEPSEETLSTLLNVSSVKSAI